MRDRAAARVQGYSGSSGAGINLQVAFAPFKAVSSEPGLANARLSLAAIALSGEAQFGGVFAAISECAAC